MSDTELLNTFYENWKYQDSWTESNGKLYVRIDKEVLENFYARFAKETETEPSGKEIK